MHPLLIANSLGVAIGTTVIALLLGTGVALAVQALGARWRGSILGLSVAVLALPAFFVAGIWMEWIGFAGAWRVGSGPWIDRLVPVVCTAGVLALLLWPVATLGLTGVWDRVDGRLFEAHPELRGWNVIRHVLGPAAGPALTAPALIIAVVALGHFTVPALFQARVWPAEVWVEFSTRYDPRAALGKSWVLALVVLGLAALAWRRPVRWPVSGRNPASQGLMRGRMGGVIRGLALVTVLGVLGISLGLPVGSALMQERTWVELAPAASASWPAALRSLSYAAAAATAACGLGALLARRPWMVVTVVTFLLPGVFVGMAVALGTAREGGSWIRDSGAVVVMALVLRYVFVGWYGAHLAWRSVHPRLADRIRIEGGGTWTMLRHGMWPQAGGTLRGAWYAVFLLCLWDVETLILVVPPGGDSLAVMIFNLLHYGHNAQVTALCLVLAGVALAPLVIAGAARAIGSWAGSSGTGGRAALATGVATAGLGLVGLGGGCSRPEATRGEAVDSSLFGRVEVIGARGTGPGYFVKPRSLAVDDAHHLYVVDMTGRVQRFGPDGRWLSQWQMPETDKGKAKGMAAAPGGGILLVEPHYHRVNRFSADGRLVGQWGVHGTRDGELWFPRAIAVGKADDCFVSEYGRVERIQRFELKDGRFLGAFGAAGAGPGQLNRAEGLGMGPDGLVRVADSCNHRILVFTPDGVLVRAYGGAGQGMGEFSFPYDIQVDAAGLQFVCEFGNSRVQVLDAEDRPLEILGGPGRGPGQMHNPWSLCLDSLGNLYVADSQNHRVLKFVRRAPLGGEVTRGVESR